MLHASRRNILGGAIAFGLGALALSMSTRASTIIDTSDLKPGEFIWEPDLAPTGALAIVVSIPEQLVHVYRNGIRIGVSTCSTGKPGHATPTGVFTILQKDKHHHSSTYNNAPMPNMNRLTWSGVALHAGNLPGYPASHGCVRLPLEFSALLFEVTHVGTPVIISGSHTDPVEVVHPGMVLGNYAEHEYEHVVAGLDEKSIPTDWEATETDPASSVIVSSVDQRILVLENGVIVADDTAFIRDPVRPLGQHVFVLNGPHDGRRGMAWHAIGHHTDTAAEMEAPTPDVIQRISSGKTIVDAMKARMHPGLVLITTDVPLHADTRSGEDFVVVSTDDA